MGDSTHLRSEARTQDRMMTSSCLPWKLSTVSIITCHATQFCYTRSTLLPSLPGHANFNWQVTRSDIAWRQKADVVVPLPVQQAPVLQHA